MFGMVHSTNQNQKTKVTKWNEQEMLGAIKYVRYANHNLPISFGGSF